MSCQASRTLHGLALECETNRAGVETIYLFNHGDFEPTVATSGDSAMTVTSLSATTGTAKMYEYVLPKNTASLSSPITVSDDGFVTYTNTVYMQFNRLAANKHAEMMAICMGGIDAIVKDKNGKYWYVGYDEYLAPTDGNAETGAAASDRNGYSITLAAESAYLPFEIQKSLFESYIENASL